MAQTTTDNKNFKGMDMFEQATDSFKAAMEAGVKFQQEAFKNMFGMFTGIDNVEDVRKRIETVATDSIEMIRKNAEQSEKLFDAGCKSGMDVMKKSFEMMKSGHGEPADLFEQSRGVWKTGFDAMRSNIENVAKANTQAIENWSSFLDRAMKTTDMKTAEFKPTASR